jgi:EpsI family protein
VSFLKRKPLLILTVLILSQMGIYYAIANRTEFKPIIQPLSKFTHTLGDWRMVQEFPMEKEIADVLQADDTMTRVYAKPDGENASLFVAFFRSQRSGVAPHSPKNCLPGAGWVVFRDAKKYLEVPGRATPIEVNYYTIQKGDNKSIVIYWYESRDRVVASEYKAKVYVVADAIRYNRTDTSLVRVMVPYAGLGEEAAAKTAEDFVRALFAPLAKSLPS